MRRLVLVLRLYGKVGLGSRSSMEVAVSNINPLTAVAFFMFTSIRVSREYR